MNRAYRPRLLLVLVAFSSLIACASGGGSLDDLPVQEYVGHYRAAAGGSWFTPCGASADAAPMWVTYTEVSVAQCDAFLSAPGTDPGDPVFVLWRAAVTTGGEVGPAGPGAPALLVREILEMRPATEGDCP
jgi:hypothetical protein